MYDYTIQIKEAFCRDRIIVGKSRRRGNLNFTCCGAMRQPRYRLQIVFLGSRKTRQPQNKTFLNYFFNLAFLDRGRLIPRL